MIRVDSVLVDVPREIVHVIQASDSLHRADSVRAVLLTLQVRDLAADRDAWKHRALLDEDQIRRSRPARFGFRSGAIVGAVTVVALVSLLH